MIIRRLIAAIQLAIFRFRYPVLRIKADRWNSLDHSRVCYAARILDIKDFRQICCIAKKFNKSLELSDECNQCPYLGSVDFSVEEDKKHVVFTPHNPRC